MEKRREAMMESDKRVNKVHKNAPKYNVHFPRQL